MPDDRDGRGRSRIRKNSGVFRCLGVPNSCEFGYVPIVRHADRDRAIALGRQLGVRRFIAAFFFSFFLGARHGTPFSERWPPKKRFLSIPLDDAKLREELAVLPKSYDGDGRLRLPPKSRSPGGDRREPTVRELLGGRSPDRADALVLALHGWNWVRACVDATRITRPLIW